MNEIKFLYPGDSVYTDVSHLVRSDSLVITNRGMSDNFRMAQSTANFTLLYDQTVFNAIAGATSDIIVRIKVNNVVSFWGYFTPVANYVENGMEVYTQLEISCVDAAKWLDKPAGDIVYFDYKILDSADKNHSIIHALVALSGVPAAFQSSFVASLVSIPNVLSVFSPSSEDESILNIIDTLLHEYGYSLSFTQEGLLSPVKWLYTGSLSPTVSFDETNTIRELQVQNTERQYEGFELTYNEVGLGMTSEGSSDILIYHDANLPYAADGTFSGYAVLPNTTYPVETNALDETTGLPQIVNQEYTDDGIAYFTNKAIKEQTGYNYKAFKSDFSSIIATTNHRLAWKGDSLIENRDGDIELVSATYGNKKATVLFRNTNLTEARLMYYFDIYAKVWYRTSERKLTVENTAGTAKLEKYSAVFIYTQAVAKNYCQTLAEMHRIGNTTYGAVSDTAYDVGSIATVTASISGVINCIITERTFDDRTRLYAYKLRKFSSNQVSLTRQSVKTAPLSAVVSPAQVSAIEAALQTQVDGKIEAWYQASTSDPYALWPPSTRASHVGDQWYQTDTKKWYRFKDAPYGWVIMQEQDALDAMTTAQGKVTVFASKTAAETGNAAKANDLYVESGVYFRTAQSAVPYTWTRVTAKDFKNLTTAQEPTDAAAPNNLVVGDKYFNTDLNAWYQWSGTAWTVTTTNSDFPEDSSLLVYYGMDNLPEIPNGTTPAYLQDTWATLDGWVEYYDCSLAVTEGMLRLTTRGYAYGYSIGKPVSINGANNPKIRLRLRRTSSVSNTITVYYATAGHSHSASFYKAQALLNTADWQIVDLDMSVLTVGGNDWITNTITNLRFDITTEYTAGPILDIDWIYVGNGSYNSSAIQDGSGNGRHTTLTNTYPVPGISGRALWFPGTNAIPMPTIPTWGKIATISVWVKNWSSGYLFQMGVNSFICNRVNNTTLSIFDGNVDRSFTIPDVLTDGKWHHIVVIYRTSTIQMMFDANLLGQVYTNNHTALSVNQYLGASSTGQYVLNQGCVIDEFRLYRYDLLESEARALYMLPTNGALSNGLTEISGDRIRTGRVLSNELVGGEPAMMIDLDHSLISIRDFDVNNGVRKGYIGIGPNNENNGLLFLDAVGEIIHDIPNKPNTAYYKYVGHLVLSTDEQIIRQVTADSTSIFRNTSADVTAFIQNKNAKAMLIRVAFATTTGTDYLQSSIESHYAFGGPTADSTGSIAPAHATLRPTGDSLVLFPLTWLAGIATIYFSEGLAPYNYNRFDLIGEYV